MDAEVLLAHQLGQERSWLYAHSTEKLSEPLLKSYLCAIQNRCDGQPVAYLTERQEFWSLEFKVTNAVLVPRPETELLVQLALEFIEEIERPTILELGTGTGAIGIALTKERSDIELTATDVSDAALEIAAFNRNHHNVHNMKLVRSNWFSELPKQAYDLILSNPPYIPTNDPHLSSPGVRFEPDLALVSGEDGLEAIRQIADQARPYLHDQSSVMIEHGYNQQPAIKDIFTREGYSNTRCHKDFNGIDRVTSATY